MLRGALWERAGQADNHHSRLEPPRAAQGRPEPPRAAQSRPEPPALLEAVAAGVAVLQPLGSGLALPLGFGTAGKETAYSGQLAVAGRPLFCVHKVRPFHWPRQQQISVLRNTAVNREYLLPLDQENKNKRCSFNLGLLLLCGAERTSVVSYLSIGSKHSALFLLSSNLDLGLLTQHTAKLIY